MATPIKILFTIPNFDTAGSGKVVYDLVKGLDKTVFAPEICCFHTKGAYFKTVASLGVPIHVFDFTTLYRPFLSFPFRLLKIRGFFKKHQFDLIHSWHWSSDFSEPLAAKLAGVPFVYTKKAMGWGNKAWRWRSWLSTKIITINSDMATFFKGMESKVIPIPLGLDTDYFEPLKKGFNTPEGMPFKETDFVIVTVANLAPVKGIEVLLEAVRSLGDLQIKVLHIGACEGAYGMSLKTTYAHEGWVYFLGKQMDVRPYLAVADVFVIPTKTLGEGLPIAPMEAMASERLVLGADVSGIRDLLNPFPDCLFEAGHQEALAHKILYFKSLRTDERQQIAVSMRQHITKNYSLHQFINQHESLYRAILNPV